MKARVLLLVRAATVLVAGVVVAGDLVAVADLAEDLGHLGERDVDAVDASLCCCVECRS